MKYDDKTVAAIQKLLSESSVPRDALPYTEEFEHLRKSYQRSMRTRISDQEFWILLAKIGKYGKLSKGERKTAPRTRSLTKSQQLEVLRLFPEGIGSRDSLPYTPELDSLHRQFSAWTKTRFTKHEFWRAVSRVAKLSRKPKPLFDDIPLGGLPQDTLEFLDRQNPWWKAQHALLEERYRRNAYELTVDKMFGNVSPVT